MPFDLGPPPFVFPKPAIIRPATDDLLRFGGDPVARALMSHQMRRAAGGKALSTTYLSTQFSATDGADFTFSGVSLGAADNSLRRIVVFANAISSASNAFDAMTVGGETVSAAVEVNTGTVTRRIGIAHVPSGATGDVVVSLTGTALRLVVYLWRIDGLGHDAAADTLSVNATPATGTIDVPAGGVVIAAARAGTSSITFDAGISSDDTETASDSGDYWNGGHTDYAVAQTGLTVTASRADAGAVQMLAASWGP